MSLNSPCHVDWKSIFDAFDSFSEDIRGYSLLLVTELKLAKTEPKFASHCFQ